MIAQSRLQALLTWKAAGTALFVAANLGWSAWATHELVALKQRQIVSVSLATLVGDFVRNESRLGGEAAATEARTRAYLVAIDRAVAKLATDGTTVLVSEATLGRSAPDRTAAVRAEIARATGGPDVR